jgi:hypothetical protein
MEDNSLRSLSVKNFRRNLPADVAVDATAIDKEVTYGIA